MKRFAIIFFAVATVFGLLLGLGTYAANPGAGSPFTSWPIGIALWLLSLVLMPVSIILAEKIHRALLAYALLWIIALPPSIVMLHGALRLSLATLGPEPSILIALGFVLGFGTMPLVIRYRRSQRQTALRNGHLSRSLNAGRATWDAQYDNDADFSKEWLTRPGCLIRLLPWIGPAIGMRIADILGRPTTIVIIAVGFLSLGYAFTHLAIVRLAVDLLEFRSLETELGRPVMLAADPQAA